MAPNHSSAAQFMYVASASRDILQRPYKRISLPPMSTVAIRSNRWAELPASLFDLRVQWVSTRHRLTLVERVCADWRRQSAGGLGWTHTLDVLWAPCHVCPDWETLRTRLGGRLQPERILHVYCFYELLCTSAPAAAAATTTTTDNAAPVAVTGDHAAPGVAVGEEEEESGGGVEEKGDVVEVRCVFSRCTSAVVSVMGSGDTRTSVELHRYFPQLQRLHVCAGVYKRESQPIATALDLDPAPDTSMSDAGLTAVRAEVAERRRQWVASLDTTEMTEPSGGRRPINIRPLPTLAHLCLSGDGVLLMGQWPALRSLIGSHYIGVYAAGLKLPCLTHLAFPARMYGSFQLLVATAAETLRALFTVELQWRNAKALLSPCKQLQTLYVAYAHTEDVRDFNRVMRELAGLSSLRDVTYYYRDDGSSCSWRGP